MNKARIMRDVGAGAVVLGVAYFLFSQFYVQAPDIGVLGGPIEGLTAQELRKFYQTRDLFKHEFTPEEGLGPLFNGRSCFECHGRPGPVGGEGRDVASTGVVRIGKIRDNALTRGKAKEEIAVSANLDTVDRMLYQGGPALERKSITSEFPEKYPVSCQVEIGTIPKDADFISMRHAPPVFGFGLIDAIPDEDINFNMFEQIQKNRNLAGHPQAQYDPLALNSRVARFGWKDQNPNLLIFTAEAMNVEMGLTTGIFRHPKSAAGISEFPHCILKYLPAEPNDNGTILGKLTYCQALLAPPKRGPITAQVLRGEKLFAKLQCAVCHIPEMKTADQVFLADPDSPAPKVQLVEVKALENKPVRAYSDFLVHNMGKQLADGIPQNGANGGEWRTTPLWGLRHKRFFIHDGRTTDLAEAILLHGGQGSEASDAFNKLPDSDKEDLLAFLRSL